MGPRTLYQGPEAPKEVFIWQDPIPEVDNVLINSTDIANLKSTILNSGEISRNGSILYGSKKICELIQY